MRGRIPLFVLLASALTFLASLFLPWRETHAPPLSDGAGVQGLLNHFSGGGRELDGWVTGVGDVAVLLVVAIVLATIAALRHPHLAAKLPLGSLGVALGYFAVGLAVEVHMFSRVLVGFTGHPPKLHSSWTYGVYLGLASAGIALLSALAYRRSELLRPRATPSEAVLGIALLISFLLPWVAFGGPEGYSIPGIENAGAAIAALGLILGAGRLLDEGGRRWRLPFAIATAILTGGAASALAAGGSHRYGTWIGVGCAVSLVALETVRAWPVQMPGLPRGLTAVHLGAAALLIVALFLPWQELDGSSYRLVGWYAVTGAAAGTLCLLLLATPALPAAEAYVLDTAVAVALLVSALGTALRGNAPFFRTDYGAIVGFVAAGSLLVTALVPFRLGRFDRSRAFVRAVPLVASVLCVASIMVPWWYVLPRDWTFQASPLYSWLAVPGLLLALYLVRLWALRAQGPARTGSRLTLVPLVLLTLPALELIRFRNGQVIWGAVILVGLCLLLAVFGWIEEDRGLENLRVPEEIWRVDRLSGVES